jgi:hypothetical protein
MIWFDYVSSPLRFHCSWLGITVYKTLFIYIINQHETPKSKSQELHRKPRNDIGSPPLRFTLFVTALIQFLFSF